MHIMMVFGTRPEAIKCVPVIHALQTEPDIKLTVCVTGQHREMLDQVLSLAGITPDEDLDIMRPGQTLTGITITVLEKMPSLLERYQPDRIMVQGDTTTAFATALAAFYAKIPVAHIEAGLRSHNMQAPWPEELNRRIISLVTDRHFAPTESARQHLIQEQVPDTQITVTGNTVIDALFYFRERITQNSELQQQMRAAFEFLNPDKKLLLVTSHRRENFDGGIERICQAINTLAKREDVQLVFPVHSNPNVREPVEKLLSGNNNVQLITPQDYLPFVYLMDKSTLIISDSGGIQEEAPALGKPVLVMRETTERPEGIEAGTAMLVGTDTARIVREATRLLDDEAHYQAMSRAHNPFGDGKASQRIVATLKGEDIEHMRGAA